MSTYWYQGQGYNEKGDVYPRDSQREGFVSDAPRDSVPKNQQTQMYQEPAQVPFIKNNEPRDTMRVGAVDPNLMYAGKYQFPGMEENVEDEEEGEEQEYDDFNIDQMVEDLKQRDKDEDKYYESYQEMCSADEANKKPVEPENPEDLEPIGDYSKFIFDEINKIRENPKSFVKIIEDAKKNVIKGRGGQWVYKKNLIRVALSKGKESFDQAIDDLKKMKGMDKLIYYPELTVKQPSNEQEEQDKDYLKKKVEEKIKDGLPVRAYWVDVLKDKDLSLLLTIVDDNGDETGKRRKIILDPETKFIGISATKEDDETGKKKKRSEEVKKTFSSFMTFSNEKK